MKKIALHTSGKVEKPIARYSTDAVAEDAWFHDEDGPMVLYTDHESALAAREVETVERLSKMLPSDLKVIADIGFPQTAIRVQTELTAANERIAELERALRNIHDTDKTPEYKVRQLDRKGNKPPSGSCWLTPREIAENAMPELRNLALDRGQGKCE